MHFHTIAALLAILLGVLLDIAQLEWVAIIVVIGLVMMMEMINTCVELVMDHLSPDYHIEIKHIKDTAAGAVLFSAFTAMVTGAIIFLPKLIVLIN